MRNLLAVAPLALTLVGPAHAGAYSDNTTDMFVSRPSVVTHRVWSLECDPAEGGSYFVGYDSGDQTVQIKTPHGRPYTYAARSQQVGPGVARVVAIRRDQNRYLIITIAGDFRRHCRPSVRMPAARQAARTTATSLMVGISGPIKSDEREGELQKNLPNRLTPLTTRRSEDGASRGAAPRSANFKSTPEFYARLSDAEGRPSCRPRPARPSPDWRRTRRRSCAHAPPRLRRAHSIG